MNHVEAVRRRVEARTCTRKEWRLLSQYDRRARRIRLLRTQQSLAPLAMMSATFGARLSRAFQAAAQAYLRSPEYRRLAMILAPRETR